MARSPDGQLRTLVNGYEARLRVDNEGTRKSYRLTAIPHGDEAAARERYKAMARIAQRLRRADLVSEIDQTLTMAAKARAGGVQTGTVTRVLADGSFFWKNACNYERKAKLSDLTTEAPCAGKLDAYMQAWNDEEGE